jgi:hypothetical protein
MYKHDLDELKRFIKTHAFQQARVVAYDGTTVEFYSSNNLLEWLDGRHPGEGSFVLLEDGAWIEWSCVSVGYEYSYQWTFHQRPVW